MKHFMRILLIAAFSSLAIFISCKKKKGGDPDPLDVHADKLEANAWVPAATSGVSKSSLTEGIGDWSGFSISFQYNDDTDVGQYTVAGVPTDDGSDQVFGTGGTQTWEFENKSNTGIIVRQDDGVRMTTAVQEGTSLTLSFTIADSGGRTDGFSGEWVFNLVPKQ